MLLRHGERGMSLNTSLTHAQRRRSSACQLKRVFIMRSWREREHINNHVYLFCESVTMYCKRYTESDFNRRNSTKRWKTISLHTKKKWETKKIVNDSLSNLCFLMTLLSKLNDVKCHYTFKSDNMWPGEKWISGNECLILWPWWYIFFLHMLCTCEINVLSSLSKLSLIHSIQILLLLWIEQCTEPTLNTTESILQKQALTSVDSEWRIFMSLLVLWD